MSMGDLSSGGRVVCAKHIPEIRVSKTADRKVLNGLIAHKIKTDTYLITAKVEQFVVSKGFYIREEKIITISQGIIIPQEGCEDRLRLLKIFCPAGKSIKT